MKKQFLTWDAANGETVVRNGGRPGPWYVRRHVRRMYGTGEINGEYFTIHKKRIAKSK